MIGAVDTSFVARSFSAPPAGGQRSRASTGTEASSTADQQAIEKLKARDAEVRAHEAAHLAAGGGLVRGGANFTYETGPDGKRYAVGGEVSIDVSPARDPRETQRKAERIKNAALAPAQPSSQDYRVAAQAARMVTEAASEIAAQAGDEAKKAADVGSANAGALKAYQNAAASFASIAGGLITARA